MRPVKCGNMRVAPISAANLASHAITWRRPSIQQRCRFGWNAGSGMAERLTAWLASSGENHGQPLARPDSIQTYGELDIGRRLRPHPAMKQPGAMWSHWWTPETPGRYEIVLKVDDPSMRTRRLDIFFYVRSVEITSV